jgi:uncharacterized protein with PQ loop repeat
MGNKKTDSKSLTYVEKEEAIEKAIKNGDREIDSFEDIYRIVSMVFAVIGVLLMILQVAQVILMHITGDVSIMRWAIAESAMLFFVGILTVSLSSRLQRGVTVKRICIWLGIVFIVNMIWLMLITAIAARLRMIFGA